MESGLLVGVLFSDWPGATDVEVSGAEIPASDDTEVTEAAEDNAESVVSGLRVAVVLVDLSGVVASESSALPPALVACVV